MYVCLYACMYVYICKHTHTYIYMVPPPHVPTPVFSIPALGRDGFLSCRTAWVNGRKSACKSYVSSLSSSAKLSPRTQIGRIQRYSKRILLNTPRIQDSRFKVQGKVLPGTLNLESWIRGVFNRIRFEYGTLRFDHCILYFEPVVVLWIVVVLCSIDTTDFARALRRLNTGTALRGNISTMLCMCLTLSGNISLIIQL